MKHLRRARFGQKKAGVAATLDRMTTAAKQSSVKNHAAQRFKTNMHSLTERLAAFQDVATHMEEYQAAWKTLVDASEAAAQSVERFSKHSDGAEDFLTFHKSWTTHNNHLRTFAHDTVANFSANFVGSDAAHALAALDSQQIAYDKEMRAKVKYIDDAVRQHKAHRFEANIRDLRSTEATYRVAEVNFEDAARDFNAAQSSQLLARASFFLTGMHRLHQDMTTQLDPSYAQWLSEQAKERGQADRVLRDERMADRIRLHHLKKATSQFDEEESTHAFEQLILRKSAPVEPQWLPGEKRLLRVERVILLRSGRHVPGILFVTSLRLHFAPYTHEQSVHVPKVGGVALATTRQRKDSTAADPSVPAGTMEEAETLRKRKRGFKRKGIRKFFHRRVKTDGDVGTGIAKAAASAKAASVKHSNTRGGVITEGELQAAADTVVGALQAITRMDVQDEVQEKGGRAERGGMLIVVFKDLRSAAFNLRFSDYEAKKLSAAMSPFAWDLSKMFALTGKLRGSGRPGWDLYSWDDEYARMGIPNPYWRVSKVNERFSVVPTYPARLVVPAGFTDEAVVEAARFRTKRRLPVLVWKDRGYPCCLYRCSQPKVGMLQSRNECDEQLLRDLGGAIDPTGKRGSTKGGGMVGKRGSEAEVGEKTLLVLDCRPRLNAAGNVAKGGGTEGANYANVSLQFLNIENIHDVRHALVALASAFQQMSAKDGVSGKRYSKVKRLLLDKSPKLKWYAHVSSLLKGAARVADEIICQGRSVLVHCSDGWDRTAQISALSQLLMDPYYRTVRGFAILIEREWLRFGHQFARRRGHGTKRQDAKDSKRSPIWLQFLDAVYQLVSQFPSAFEFNAALLVDLADFVDTCRFGTFLMDSQQARVEAGLAAKSDSVWAFVFAPGILDSYSNPLYDVAALGAQSAILSERLLPIQTEHTNLKLFLPFFIRLDESPPPALMIAAQEAQTMKTAVTICPVVSMALRPAAPSPSLEAEAETTKHKRSKSTRSIFGRRTNAMRSLGRAKPR